MSEVLMDFLERWFDVNVDSGSGALEFLYVVAAVAAVSVWSLRRFFVARLTALRKRRARIE
jgi:hypothetical protein